MSSGRKGRSSIDKGQAKADPMLVKDSGGGGDWNEQQQIEWEILKTPSTRSRPSSASAAGTGGGQLDDEESEGFVTVEYYEDEDEGESLETSLSCSPPGAGGSEGEEEESVSLSSETNPSRPSLMESDCKTYDFMHSSAIKEEEFLLTDGELFEQNYFSVDDAGIRKLKSHVFSDEVRGVMGNYYKIGLVQQERELQMKRGSFSVCPRGGWESIDSNNNNYHHHQHEGLWKKRKQTGPFLSCAFDRSHECGDEFQKVGMTSGNTKPVPDWESWTRPYHFKERKAKFFKQCKHCEILGFTHYRNPKQHYEDYVNQVTYKSHNNQSKVWQQHLADLKFSLDESDPQYEDIVEKCRYYRTSPIVIHATRYSRAPPALKSHRKSSTMLVRKKSSVVIRRPQGGGRAGRLLKSASSRSIVSSSRPRTRSAKSAQKINQSSSSDSDDDSEEDEEEAEDKKEDEDETNKEALPPERKSSFNQKKNEKKQKTRFSRTSFRQRPGTPDKNKRPPSAMQQKMKLSMTRLINSGSSNSRMIGEQQKISSKGFVKKQNPRPQSRGTSLSLQQRKQPQRKQQNRAKLYKVASKPKDQQPRETRFIQIQKLKPNISSKFLRNRRNSKRGNKIKSGSGNGEGVKKESSGYGAVRKRRSAVGSGEGGKADKVKKKEKEEPEEKEDDGSYAQFRDRNGNFDSEKYRQSILKLLGSDSGNGGKRKLRKKKGRTASNQDFTTLPQIRNPYSNVKSKTVSNFPKKAGKRKGDGTGNILKESPQLSHQDDPPSYSETGPDHSNLQSLYERWTHSQQRNLQDFSLSESDISLQSKYSNERYMESSKDKMQSKVWMKHGMFNNNESNSARF